METPEKKRPPRRRRRGAKRKSKGVLEADVPRVDLAHDPEAPLRKDEIATLKEHFRFLLRYRRELRLKVNAAEDLLLNGAREPESRGVCQHLLAKVDRASVVSACERMDDATGLRLLVGVIRFSADIEYVLLLLEKIKLTSSSADATTALSQGLERIDFDQVTSGQMRRVLGLVVELFDERERPMLLLGLLESPSFRGAFDKSIPDLPDTLSRIVVPLRAVQAVVLHGQRNTLDPVHLREGVRMLLRGDERNLLRRSVDVRRRLFDFGLQVCTGDHVHHRSLRQLLESLPQPDKRHSTAAINLTRHLLAAHEDHDAARLLVDLAQGYPDFHLPKRWLEILESERLGRYAFANAGSERVDALGHARWQRATWLDRMSPVHLQIAESAHVEEFKAMAYVLAEIGVAGVIPVLASGVNEAGEPYLVVPDWGPALDHTLAHKDGLSLADSIRMAQLATGILSDLASASVLLPDAAPSRFAFDPHGTLWLVDASGASRADTRAETRDLADVHFTRAKALCRAIFASARSYIPPQDLLDEIDEARHAGELMRRLAGSVHAGGR